MRMTRTVSLVLLVSAVAFLATGCEAWQFQGDDRSKDQIKEDHAGTRQQLAAKQAELGRLKARLLEEGWTHNEGGDLVPPRGMDRGGQVRETEQHLHELEGEIARLENRLTYHERLWRYRGYEVAELTRDAAIRVSPPAHRD
jgi:predicted small secreted protein